MGRFVYFSYSQFYIFWHLSPFIPFPSFLFKYPETGDNTPENTQNTAKCPAAARRAFIWINMIFFKKLPTIFRHIYNIACFFILAYSNKLI